MFTNQSRIITRIDTNKLSGLESIRVKIRDRLEITHEVMWRAALRALLQYAAPMGLAPPWYPASEK